MLYPLKFSPILKEMIWGGSKIPETLNIAVEADTKIGENFTLSGLENDLSVVSNGDLKGKNLVELINEYKGQLIGDKVYAQFGSKFPLLLKYIDANDDLSIQVHPNDELAKIKHNSFGKTEMWYVIEAEENASLISGFSKVTSAKEFEELHQNKNIMSLMQMHNTQKGDTFFIPAGKVHSIGRGNLIAEIQQTSDITYRIYDFDRTDKFGNPRELHHELAMDAMNFSDNESGKVDYTPLKNQSVNVAQCQYFTTNFIEVNGELSKNYDSVDSFVILMNVGGECSIQFENETISLNMMETALIPACIKDISVSGNAELLEVYI
ncbi:type I phosphomannose isomerase catalytic subunit [Plebeiibacterium sediminum]|uniref:Phosphohexomutase n=1 Tax=Plebeiibacterium sediminum TaxID=2992112 RepID=A0AAE3M7F8_9BACT|nr:type I phosphomannose isomerase catalytic subunit [Plebeiobacterium sediminum]MCW3788554.1 class I mannose-6-phosphate isomerase [Plebeiobacterium sediminum]